jgi:hypothetical protein
MVSETGDGRWTVAVEPDEVTTVTDEAESGTVSVVVPPYEVKTWLTTGDEATGTVYVCPLELTAVTELTGVTDGDETNSELETEVTV